MGEAREFSIDIDATPDGAAVVRLGGELDIAGAPALQSALLELAGSDVVVDLSDLSFIDSSGLNTLLRAYKRAIESGERFTLRSPGTQAVRTLDITGLDAIFTIEGSPGPMEAAG